MPTDPNSWVPNPPPVVDPVTVPGDLISTVPKNPLSSTAIWGLLVLVLTIMTKKWVPALFQDETLKAALELAGYLSGFGMAAWGRWHATRPLGFGNEPVSKIVKTLLLPLLIPVLLCAPGCTATNTPKTPQGWLANSEQDFSVVLRSIRDLHAAGLVSDAQMNDLKPYVKSAYDGFSKAEQALAAGDKTSAAVEQAAAQTAIDFLKNFEARRNPIKSATQPAGP